MNKYDEVISSTSGLIYMIIRKHFQGYDVEDLYQEGVKGVIKAYDNYRNDRSTKFSTYAYTYIFGEIYAYVNNNKSIKIGKEYSTLYRKINEARNILEQKLMKEPSISELSSFLEISPSIIESVILSMNKVDSLDRTINKGDKDMSYYDIVGDNVDYCDIDRLMLEEEINKLPEAERKLIFLRYYEDMTQSEVAGILGMSQVGVSRCEKKTLKKILENYQNVA